MVVMKAAYNFRAYLSKAQMAILNCRKIFSKEFYNLLLEKSRAHYWETGKTPTESGANIRIMQIKQEKNRICRNVFAIPSPQGRHSRLQSDRCAFTTRGDSAGMQLALEHAGSGKRLSNLPPQKMRIANQQESGCIYKHVGNHTGGIMKPHSRHGDPSSSKEGEYHKFFRTSNVMVRYGCAFG